MWHHADGAWGGLGAAVPALAPHYGSIGGVDSLTVDPHKTLSVPVGCGALLVPDPEHLHTTFAHQASYLTSDPEALPWLSHATIELTRPGTRTLGLWATLHHLGRDGVTGLIEYYPDLTERLRERITAEPRPHLLAGGPWPVACFRITDPHGSDSAALHTRVARRVQDKPIHRPPRPCADGDRTVPRPGAGRRRPRRRSRRPGPRPLRLVSRKLNQNPTRTSTCSPGRTAP
ncbi:pyridoxal-dependent decarboxylase [Streptomyces sp. NPDC005385]|uniref:pyridoxal phosphate-dependent decarboxylase family protein n=1 Tax=Streptomyces sp. NPDC005385 TaxID=3157039 RepID=UPI0033A9B2A3